MSSATSFNFSPLEKNYLSPRPRSHSSVPQIITIIRKHEHWNSTTNNMYSTSVNRRGRALNAANSPPPPPVSPMPLGSPSSGWSKWMLLTLIPPALFIFFKSKWGRLLLLKQQLDKTLARVEVMADELEDVAEKVDEMADEISEKLPEGSSLKNAIDLVGELAEKTDKAADCVDGLSEKVDDAEDELKTLILKSDKGKGKAKAKRGSSHP